MVCQRSGQLAATLDVSSAKMKDKSGRSRPLNFRQQLRTQPPPTPLIISGVQAERVYTNDLPTPNLHTNQGICEVLPCYD